MIFLLAYPLPFPSQNLSCVNASTAAHVVSFSYSPPQLQGRDEPCGFVLSQPSTGNSNQDEAVEQSPFRLPLLKLPSDKLWRIT